VESTFFVSFTYQSTDNVYDVYTSTVCIYVRIRAYTHRLSCLAANTVCTCVYVRITQTESYSSPLVVSQDTF
jgi:hypothetical protein